jgi:hypothetical protein
LGKGIEYWGKDIIAEEIGKRSPPASISGVAAPASILLQGKKEASG